MTAKLCLQSLPIGDVDYGPEHAVAIECALNLPVLAGLIRFSIEFIRVNDRVLGPLTVAHLLSVGVIIAGILIIGRSGFLSPTRPKTSR